MVLVAVPLLILLAGLVAIAIAQQSRAFSDALVRFFFPYLPVYGLIGRAIDKAITGLASWISNRVGHFFTAHEARIVAWFGGLLWYVKLVFEASTWPGDLLFQVTRWLLETKIPQLIRALVRHIAGEAHVAKAVATGTVQTVYKVVKLAKADARAAVIAAFPGLALELPALRWLYKHWRLVAAVVAGAAGAIAIPIPGVGGIERGERAIKKRLSRVEKLLGVTAIAAVMARVLHVSPKCLRDGNVGRTARALCGMDTGLLDSLLFDVLAVAGVLSVVEFAEGCRTVEDEAVKLMSGLVKEWP